MCAASTMEKGNTSDDQKNAVNLDDILVTEVGQFGKYQLMTLTLAALPIIFYSFGTGEYIFTVARIPHRCRVRCDGSVNDVPNPVFRPDWLLNAINGTSLTSFESCARFDENTIKLNSSNDICPADWFNRTTKVTCEDGYVYENTHSVVYDFDMGCDEWRRSQIGSIRTIGTLLVHPITGFISDRWGRRVALTLNAFNTAWVGLVRSFVNSYEWFLALEVIESAIGAGAFASCYILVTELVGPDYRVIASTIISSLISLGNIILGLVAWGVPSWRPLTRVLYAPQLFVISYFWILSESVRWLMSKGRYEESEAILMKVAKYNTKELSDKTLKALRVSEEAAKSIKKKKEPWLIVLVFRSRKILSRCIVTPIMWITNTFIYCGMNINSVNLSGNPNLNYVYVAAVDIPGTWIACFLLNRIGRKPVLCCAYCLCAACQFAFALIPDGLETLSMVVYLAAKFCIAAVINPVYIYTAELYPTNYRHTFFAFSSAMGSFGALIAPLTPAIMQEVWKSLPSVLFGSLALMSGLLIFTLPETLGTKLPDTIEQAEELTRKTIDLNR